MLITSRARFLALLLLLSFSPALPAMADSDAKGTAADVATRAEKMPVTVRSAEVRALYARGERLLDSWRLDDALPIFERIVELEPDFVLGWVGLAWSQPRFKDMFAHADHALELLDKAEVSQAEELRVRAFHASMNSDPASWRRYTEQLVELYPGDERAAVLLGNVLMGTGNDRQGALAQYRRATEIAPSFYIAWRGIGTVESLLDRKEAAENSFRRLVELAPEDPRSSTDLAAFLLEEGELDEARRLYLRAIELSPMFEDAERGLATVRILQGRHEEARRHLRGLYDKAPHDGFRSGIHFALAVTYADEGRFDKAVEELEKNFELSAKIHDSLAMAIDLSNMIDMLLQAGRFDQAEARSRELLGHIVDDPAQPEARKRNSRATFFFRQGRIALYRGDLVAAKENAAAFSRRAEEIGQDWLLRLAHQLPGEIALAEQRWDDAIRELMASNPDGAGNMYRIALAFRGKGDEDGYRRMLGYVVDYRGVLNLGYAKVRREAEKRLQGIG